MMSTSKFDKKHKFVNKHDLLRDQTSLRMLIWRQCSQWKSISVQHLQIPMI